jgi:hypothetical protein
MGARHTFEVTSRLSEVKSRVAEGSSHVAEGSSHVAEVSSHVTEVSSHVTEVSSRVSEVISRVSKVGSRHTEVRPRLADGTHQWPAVRRSTVSVTYHRFTRVSLRTADQPRNSGGTSLRAVIRQVLARTRV